MRIGWWLAMGALIGMTGAMSCGDDTDDEPDGTGATGGSGGSGGAASISGLALINPACGTGTSGTVSQECVDCTTEHCAAEMEDCFGEAWQTNLQAGICVDFGACVSACDCGNNACFKACIQALDDNLADPCRPCVVDIVACQASHCDSDCEITTGQGGSGSGGSGSGGGPGND